MEEKILQNLKDREFKLCVLATSSQNGVTQAATIGYSVMDDLTLVMSTNPKSRKIQHLKENNHASVVIGVSFSEMNIQMDGTVKVITEGEEYKKLDDFFFTQNPGALKFKSPDTVFIKFTPSWVRYLDHTASPVTSEEKFLN